MKKTETKKPLLLSTETLRTLRTTELAAAGGGTDVPICPPPRSRYCTSLV